MKKIISVMSILLIMVLLINMPSKSCVTRIQYKKANTKNIFENKNYDFNNKIINSEEDFIVYMKDVLKEVDDICKNKKMDSTTKEMLKNTYIKFSDFIFYNGEIKGMAFSDLSITSKREILNYYQKLDKDIDKKIPDYKKKIKDISNKQYNNLKDKTKKLIDKYKNEIKTDSYKVTKKESKKIITKIKEKIKQMIKKVSD